MPPKFCLWSDSILPRYPFDKAIEAFEATKAGKSSDGKGLIKAVISGPDVSVDDR